MADFNFADYLDAPSNAEVSGIFLPEESTLGKNLVSEDFNVALIGVPTDGDLNNLGTADAPNAVRKQLHELASRFRNIHVADLGNIKTGKKLNDAYSALTEVVTYLASKKIVSVIIGGSQDLTIPMLNALKSVKNEETDERKKVRLTVIDSKIDLSAKNEPLSANNFWNPILEDDSISEMALLGLQNYYYADWQAEKLVEKGVVVKRLREIAQNSISAEPFLRDADILSLDMASVRHSEAPGHALSIPNGFNGVDICQLAHYAGLSDTTLVYGLFGYNPSFDDSDQTAALVAEVAWHILEGIDKRYNDYPVCDLSKYRKYVVLPKFDGDSKITFYSNTANGRWWVEIPTLQGAKIYSCTAKDYSDFCNNAIPDVWMRHYMK